MAEHLWRHRDKYAAQLADRLTLRKIIDTDDDALELVVAIRYVRHLQANALFSVFCHTYQPSILCTHKDGLLGL